MENIEIIKKLCNCSDVKYLSSGGNGSAFLVTINDKKIIYKLEKMDEYDTNNKLTSEYYRQIQFNNIAINYPNKFLILENHGLITNCTYKHPKYDEFVKVLKEDTNIKPRRKRALERFLRKNSQLDCYWLAYVPYLDGSYDDIRTHIYENPDMFLDFMYQIIETINIMRNEGYSQNDLNSNNIMYKKINKNKYQWYIIDYGYVYNKKFPITILDKNLHDRDLFGMDLANLIYFCTSPSLDKFIKDNEIKEDDNIFYENIKNELIFSKIKKYLDYFEQKAHMTVSEIICKILYPDIYLKCILTPEHIYRKYKNDQLFPKILMYCLEHHNDIEYDDILLQIKNEMNKQQGGNDTYMHKYMKYKLKYINLKNIGSI